MYMSSVHRGMGPTLMGVGSVTSLKRLLVRASLAWGVGGTGVLTY